MSKNTIKNTFDFVPIFQQRMDELGWSRFELAKHTPVSEGTLSKYWNHAQEPRLSAVLEIAKALNLKISIHE